MTDHHKFFIVQRAENGGWTVRTDNAHFEQQPLVIGAYTDTRDALRGLELIMSYPEGGANVTAPQPRAVPASDAPVLWASADPGALAQVQELLAKLDHRLNDTIAVLQEEKETLQGEIIVLVEDVDEAEAEVARLREALTELLDAVGGPTGFAGAVRRHSGLAYPWPSLDLAETKAAAALAAKGTK